jgi:hypothetical protein
MYPEHVRGIEGKESTGQLAVQPSDGLQGFNSGYQAPA